MASHEEKKIVADTTRVKPEEAQNRRSSENFSREAWQKHESQQSKSGDSDSETKPADSSTNGQTAPADQGNRQAKPQDQKSDTSNKKTENPDRQPSESQQDNPIANTGSAIPADKNTNQREAAGSTAGADLKATPEGKVPKSSGSLKDQAFITNREPQGEAQKATQPRKGAVDAAPDSTVVKNQRGNQLPDQPPPGQTATRDTQPQISALQEQAQITKKQQTEFDNIVHTAAGAGQNTTQAGLSDAAHQNPIKVDSSEAAHNKAIQEGLSKAFQPNTQLERTIPDDRLQARGLEQVKNESTQPGVDKSLPHQIKPGLDHQQKDLQQNHTGVDRQQRMPLLDAKGNQINLAPRADIIEMINGPIRNTIGIKDGVNNIKDGAGIILIAAARVFDGVKGNVSTGRGNEAAGDKAIKAGKNADATLRSSQLEDLRARTLKLPAEVKEQGVKIATSLIKNPNEKFDSKDSGISDAMRRLNKTQLDTVRIILTTGVKPDFSGFGEKLQTKFTLVFKALIDQAKTNLAEKGQLPAPADKSNQAEKGQRPAPADKSNQAEKGQRPAPADKGPSRSDDKTAARPSDKTPPIPNDKTAPIDRTTANGKRPAEKSSESNTKVTKSGEATPNPRTFIDNLIGRLQSMGVLKPLSEVITKFKDKQETRVLDQTGAKNHGTGNHGIGTHGTGTRVLAEKSQTALQDHNADKKQIGKLQETTTKVFSADKRDVNNTVAPNKSSDKPIFAGNKDRDGGDKPGKVDKAAENGQGRGFLSPREWAARQQQNHPRIQEVEAPAIKPEPKKKTANTILNQPDHQEQLERKDDANIEEMDAQVVIDPGKILEQTLKVKRDDTGEGTLEDRLREKRNKDKSKKRVTRMRCTVKEGDNLKDIAIKFFGDESMAPLIFHYNKHIEIREYKGKQYAVLRIGSVLTMPEDEEIETYKKANISYEHIDFAGILAAEIGYAKDRVLSEQSTGLSTTEEVTNPAEPEAQFVYVETSWEETAKLLYGKESHAKLLRAINKDIQIEIESLPKEQRKIRLPALHVVAAFERAPEDVIRRLNAGESIPVPAESATVALANQQAGADQESTSPLIQASPTEQDSTLKQGLRKPNAGLSKSPSSTDLRFEYQGPVYQVLSKGVKILESECFSAGEQGIRISLRLLHNSQWQNVCHYEIYPIESRKRQYYSNGGSKQSSFTLPPAQVKEMSRNDFRNNWKAICDEFWTI